jgi:hypothetical protein
VKVCCEEEDDDGEDEGKAGLCEPCVRGGEANCEEECGVRCGVECGVVCGVVWGVGCGVFCGGLKGDVRVEFCCAKRGTEYAFVGKLLPEINALMPCEYE